jgi:Secretion system C-terminal sorting domain
MKKIYFLVISCWVSVTCFAQLNEFMVMDYFADRIGYSTYKAGGFNTKCPWYDESTKTTNYDNYFNLLKNSYGFNTIQIGAIYEPSQANKQIQASCAASLKSIIKFWPLSTFDVDSNKFDGSFNEYIRLINRDKAILSDNTDYNFYEYYNSKGTIGFDISDEPTYTAPLESPQHIQSVFPLADAFREYNPNLLRWANLQSVPNENNGGYVGYQNYVERYINDTHPNILSYDCYPGLDAIYCPAHLFKSSYVMGTMSAKYSIPAFFVTTPYTNLDGFRKRNYAPDGTLSETCPENRPSTIKDDIYKTNVAKSKYEFFYDIYTALMHGMKGIAYWNGFDWVQTTECKLDNNKTGGYSFELFYEGDTKTQLSNLHKRLTDKVISDQLLSLTFKSSYFWDMGDKKRGAIPHPNCTYLNFVNDPYARTIFPLTSTPAASSGVVPTNLAISFLTNKDNEIYFWVFNNSINRDKTGEDPGTNTMNITLLLNKFYTYTDVLNKTQLTTTPSIFPTASTTSLQLAPGEARLFKATRPSSSNEVTITNVTTCSSFSDITYAKKITMGPNVVFDNCFSNTTPVKYIAGSIVLGKGVVIKNNSHVLFQAATSSNYINANLPTPQCSQVQLVKSFETIEDADKAKDLNLSSVTIFPNPTHSDFKVAMTLQEGERTVISVYDSMGKLVKTQAAAGAETTISIADFPAGVYVVRFNADGKEHHYKVVKM